MNSSGLFAEIKKHPKILALVILVHIGLAILLGLNLSNDEAPPMPMAQKHKIIDAVVVDGKKFDERKKQEKLAEQKKIEDKKAAEKKKLLAAQKKKAAQKRLEEKRLAEKKKSAEKKRQQETEKKKLALAKKKEQEKLKKEKLAKEKKIKEKLAKEKQAKEKLAKEKQEKERLEAEKKRKAEEKRIAEEKRKAEEKAEFERALLEEERREEEAKKQAARAARLQTQLQQYIIQIGQKVENNWLRPVTTTAGQSCEIIVTQTMSGDVIDVRLQACTSDNAFQRSVERAVRKASPLPLPPDPELFDREIHFKFKPD